MRNGFSANTTDYFFIFHLHTMIYTLYWSTRAFRNHIVDTAAGFCFYIPHLKTIWFGCHDYHQCFMTCACVFCTKYEQRSRILLVTAKCTIRSSAEKIHTQNNRQRIDKDKKQYNTIIEKYFNNNNYNIFIVKKRIYNK